MTVTRSSYQDQEAAFLASYAIKSAETKGRKHREKEHELRTPFQRDRDRIIHSTAFRRLQYKTQVFVNHEGDHYRTRLTHTIETAQIGRSIARALKLNEDLIEAIALAHDLGHPPFGHAGEWALEELMERYGGFEHNQQTLRIVEQLEDSYPDFPGLNLTFETREGIKKHPEKFYKDRTHRYRTLEADLADFSDEVAYNSHDLDDGLRSGLITEQQMEEVEIWRECVRYVRKKYKKISSSHRKRLTIRLIINRMVMDAVENTRKQITRLKIQTPKDLQKTQKPVVTFSKDVKRQSIELKRFLHRNLYKHHHVLRMTDKGQRIIQAVFKLYLKKPEQLPPVVLKRRRSEGLHRVVCDYVAGMTDRFVMDEYRRFFEPYERV